MFAERKCQMEYEVIVVGGGHAGCEAAHACAYKGHKTLLLTGNINRIATLSCNPSIGGSAKGIIVREIDALGGIQGFIADQSQIQMKMLNQSKGPAVQSLRSQIDKEQYVKNMIEYLKSLPNLDIKEGFAEELMINNNVVHGIIMGDGTKISSQIVILTTGTYLKSNILIGSERTISGPDHSKPSYFLSDNLRKYGFEIIRLKTGTPPRIKKSSIDFTKTKYEPGDNKVLSFSLDFKTTYSIEDQEPCYLTYTTPKTHEIIRENIHKSSMYGGIEGELGIGPRYCPSIEDKIVRFHDKERHQLFLEPEVKNSESIYLQGFSTSMPKEVQEEMVRSLPGLENASILKYAYAIEYDAINPLQVKNNLETKILNNLFTAGQINGTSGYEEAAAQGLIAGINAALKLEKKDPLILNRSDAYIGVLIDDLITKGTSEPYRMLTSRAEYRLLLRHDNADLRLREYGHQVGLINEVKYHHFQLKKMEIENLIAKIKSNTSWYLKLKRPDTSIQELVPEFNHTYEMDVLEQVEINIKYEGYIEKMKKDVEKMLKNESKMIPNDIDYNKIQNLASEALQKLNKIRPASLGAALRISGVNPSDIAILTVYLKRYYHHD